MRLAGGRPHLSADKLAILDIKARDSDGRFLNVEMQKSLTPALRERLVYYAACLYSSQMSEGDEYPDLRPTIGICLLSAIMFPGIPAGHLKFALSDLEHGVRLTDHFAVAAAGTSVSETDWNPRNDLENRSSASQPGEFVSN